MRNPHCRFVLTVKSSLEMSQYYVTFSEYMNFKLFITLSIFWLTITIYYCSWQSFKLTLEANYPNEFVWSQPWLGRRGKSVWFTFTFTTGANFILLNQRSRHRGMNAPWTFICENFLIAILGDNIIFTWLKPNFSISSSSSFLLIYGAKWPRVLSRLVPCI